MRSTLWFVAALALGTSVAVWMNARSEGALLRFDEGEVHIYVLAAERMLEGSEVFRPDDVKPFTYPPFMALLFVPMTILPQTAVRPVWYAANLLILWIAVALVGSMLRGMGEGTAGGSRPRMGWPFWILVLVIAGRHVVSPIENQSNDGFVLLCATAGVYAMYLGQDARAGIWFGLGAAAKATPLLFLPYLLWKRRFVAAGSTMLGLAAALAATEIFLPRSDGRLWITAWYQTFVAGIEVVGGNTEGVGNAWCAWNIRNQNVASLVYRFVTPVGTEMNHTFDVSLIALAGWPRRCLQLAAQLAVLGFIAWASRRRTAPASRFRSVGEGGMVVCGMVLLSPMSSKAHFCVLLIPIAFCVYAFARSRNPVIGACLAVLFLGAVTAKGIVGTDWGYQILARGSVTWCTLAALLGTAIALEREEDIIGPTRFHHRAAAPPAG